MCVALPTKILEKNDGMCWVGIGDARIQVSLIMTPEAEVGDWVLVHAGLVVRQIPEEHALETLRMIESIREPAT